MKLHLILNGDDVALEGEPRESLLAILQRQTDLFVDKACCGKGTCGRCHVHVEGREVPSCLIPFYQIRQKEVVTPEGFQVTEDYRQFWKILDAEGLVVCPECTDARIFHLLSYLEAFPLATPLDCQNVIGEIPCRCGSRPVFERSAQRWLERKEVGRGPRR